MGDRHYFLQRPRNLPLLVALCLVAGCAGFLSFTSGRSSMMQTLEDAELSGADLGRARFVYDDFGHLTIDTLSTNALPWKMTSAALVLYETRESGDPPDAALLRDIYQRFGFIYPSALANWQDGLIDGQKPLGIVTAPISRLIPNLSIEVANFSCASCHGGRLFDSDGLATNDVWLGLPNTSLDLDGYTDAVFHSLRYAVQNEAALLATVEQLFPHVQDDELIAITRYLVPLAQDRLAALESGINRALPFLNGGPGTTNGLAALNIRLNLASADQSMDVPAYVSIPQLVDVGFRSSLLCDGVYYPPGRSQFERIDSTDTSATHNEALARMVAFFTTPTQGGDPESAVRAMPAVIESFQFLGAYESPSFPGTVDSALAAQGRAVYKRYCAACHGDYSQDAQHPELTSFPNVAVPLDQIKTDPMRSELISQKLLDAINKSAVANYVAARRTDAYVAPSLTGIWSTAPYLHNGSVPTLWHLMHPKQRPLRFAVGGHRLNYDKMGIDGSLQSDGVYRFPENYEPMSRSTVFDSALPGKSNSGHENPFAEMTENDKTAVLEFLKLL